MQRLLTGAMLLAMAAAAAADEGEPAPADARALATVEAEILRAMGGNMGAGFAELRRQIQALDPAARRSLAVSVRPGVYQWRFHGEHPADAFQLGIFEYVVSSEIKNYESLLVVEGPELKRLQRFGEAFDRARRRHPTAQVDVQFSWAEGGRVRSVDLWEILATHEAAQVEEFIKRLDSSPDGLGAINLAADPAALPKKNTPAQVVITLRLPPKH